MCSRLFRPILDVLFEQLIFKRHVLDRASGNVVERQNADQHTVIDHRHVGDVQLGHQAAQMIDAVVGLGDRRIDFHDVATLRLHQIAAVRIEPLRQLAQRVQPDEVQSLRSRAPSPQ